MTHWTGWQRMSLTPFAPMSIATGSSVCRHSDRRSCGTVDLTDKIPCSDCFEA